MIGLPAGTRIWLAADLTEMRAGMNGLAAKSKLHWLKTRAAAMCSCSAVGAAICSRCCGGPAMACVRWQSDLNVAVSSGRRQTAAASRRPRRRCRCCSKGSTGAGRIVLGDRRQPCKRPLPPAYSAYADRCPVPSDINALKALLLAHAKQIVGLQAQLNTRVAKIEHLKLRRTQFGHKSENIAGKQGNAIIN
jgi:hypothetical protein